MIKKKCENCNEEIIFLRYPSNGYLKRFHPHCRITWNKGKKLHYEVWNKGKKTGIVPPNKLKPVIKECIFCKKEFGVQPYRKDVALFCSLTCKYKEDVIRMKGNQYSLGFSPSLETRKKLSIAFQGKKNSNWQGGKTNIGMLIREGLEYRVWRKKILERDNYICQNCGIRGGLLHVDHWPKTFAQIVEENNIQSLEEAIECEELWDIKKNRTLCFECHKNTDTYLNNRKVGVFYGT